MKKSLLFLLCVTLLLSACSKKTSTLDQSTDATPQAVIQKEIQWKTLSRTTPPISFKYPETAQVSESSNSTALLSLNFDIAEKKGNDTLSLTVQKTKPTRAEVEDLETDNYNGAERTLGRLKANCYFRKNSYVQDQYTFLNKRYTGTDPKTGYRLDCTGPVGTNFVYLRYQNDLDDLSYYRQQEKMLNEMLASIQ